MFSLTQIIAISVLPVLFAITVHEVAHGWVASKCGDQTARLSGRLTLNPAKHIDLIGTIVVPIVMLIILVVTGKGILFGWAKPVPIDARNMRNPRRDMAFVALAGPLSNLLMALLWALIAKINFIFLNSLPWLTKPMVYMGEIGILINVILAVLNFLPFPPLDGGRILVSLLPSRAAWYINRAEPYLIVIVLLLMLTGLFSYIISPPIFFLSTWITSIFGLPELAI